MNRQCADCKQRKPYEEFKAEKRSRLGIAAICKVCHADRENVRRHSNLEVARAKATFHRKDQRARNLKKFGLTEQDYNNMLYAQNGVCAICGYPEIVLTNRGKLKNLAVDHNKATGKVRALLCQKHNQALGLIGEDTSIAYKMIKYIEKHNS